MSSAQGIRLDLMLLVDGELTGRQATQVARRCRESSEMGAAVADLETDRALVRAAFPPAQGAAGPIHELIDAALGTRRRRQRHARAWRVAAPLLASALTAALFGAGAVAVAERRAADAASVILAEQARDRHLMAAAFKAAVDTQVSGGSVTWQNPASGSRGSVTPLRTFKTVDGRWCREYRQEIEAAALSERRIGIACRDASGWQLKLERPAAA